MSDGFVTARNKSNTSIISLQPLKEQRRATAKQLNSRKPTFSHYLHIHHRQWTLKATTQWTLNKATTTTTLILCKSICVCSSSTSSSAATSSKSARAPPRPAPFPPSPRPALRPSARPSTPLHHGDTRVPARAGLRGTRATTAGRTSSTPSSTKTPSARFPPRSSASLTSTRASSGP